MRQEAVDGLRTFDLKQNGDDCKVNVATLKLQYNFAHMLANLPTVIKEQDQLNEQRKKKVTAFKNSQEGGTL